MCESFAFQVFQAGGQQSGAEATQAGLEVAEPFGASEQFADQQQRPALADEVEGARGRAVLVVGSLFHFITRLCASRS
ncbi:hypothetical protein ACPZ19_42200 [Amycolatopsis lurida]